MNELDQIFSRARQELSDSQAILKELLAKPTETDDTESASIHQAHLLQLILQYRLDSQSALAKLLQLDHGLLQILGIEPQHSTRVNLERMEFALGNDDLQSILHSLSQLVHSLSLVAYQYQQKQNKLAARRQALLSDRATATHTKPMERLQKAIVLQKQFILSLTEVSNTLAFNEAEGNKTAEIGPVLDHIAALRGPVSQFFQAVQNGLELTHELYEKTYISVELENTLEELLHQASCVLQQTPLLYQPQHFFTPAKEKTDELLEEKASNRRLKQFFHH